ncbi:MAG: type II toxin-antitoxin system VapC family toxin [Candidatus Methanodesulfokora sp.]|jgi:predicted nucleic acid-binding protein
MSFLFDSSAIINIVRRRKARYLAGHTLDLAFYEILNAVWKEAFLLKSLPESIAIELMKEAVTAWRILPKVDVDEIEVFEKAKEHMIPAYDAAYMTAALKNGLVLVTDDSRLRSISKGISSQEYIKIYES